MAIDLIGDVWFIVGNDFGGYKKRICVVKVLSPQKGATFPFCGE